MKMTTKVTTEKLKISELIDALDKLKTNQIDKLTNREIAAVIEVIEKNINKY